MNVQYFRIQPKIIAKSTYTNLSVVKVVLFIVLIILRWLSPGKAIIFLKIAYLLNEKERKNLPPK